MFSTWLFHKRLTPSTTLSEPRKLIVVHGPLNNASSPLCQGPNPTCLTRRKRRQECLRTLFELLRASSEQLASSGDSGSRLESESLKYFSRSSLDTQCFGGTERIKKYAAANAFFLAHSCIHPAIRAKRYTLESNNVLNQVRRGVNTRFQIFHD